MCGRYSQQGSQEHYGLEFRVSRISGGVLPPRYNVAPGAYSYVVRNDDGERELAVLKWGLVPFWAKDPKTGYSMINARAETVATKPSFRAAFKSRRCIIPVEGFYEWRGAAGKKKPYFIRRANGKTMPLAGLWERWSRPDQNSLETFTIIVGEPNELVGQIHDRMPIILDPPRVDVWLDPQIGVNEILQKLLTPFPANEMDMYPVSTKVNNARNEGEELITRIL
jgi:putative SOS response-associated peptidase YedK